MPSSQFSRFSSWEFIVASTTSARDSRSCSNLRKEQRSASSQAFAPSFGTSRTTLSWSQCHSAWTNRSRSPGKQFRSKLPLQALSMDLDFQALRVTSWWFWKSCEIRIDQAARLAGTTLNPFSQERSVLITTLSHCKGRVFFTQKRRGCNVAAS